MCLKPQTNWNKLHFLHRRKVQICIVGVYFCTNILQEEKKKKAFCSRDNIQSKKRRVNMGEEENI